MLPPLCMYDFAISPELEFLAIIMDGVVVIRSVFMYLYYE